MNFSSNEHVYQVGLARSSPSLGSVRRVAIHLESWTSVEYDVRYYVFLTLNRLPVSVARNLEARSKILLFGIARISEEPIRADRQIVNEFGDAADPGTRVVPITTRPRRAM